MDIETFRTYCLSKKAVTEELPFDENTLVFKVMNKMFALTDIDSFKSINLKCDPGLAMELRENHNAVQPGYHMNKKHWNTVMMDGSIPDKLIMEWIEHSYELVIEGLSKAHKNELDLIDE